MEVLSPAGGLLGTERGVVGAGVRRGTSICIWDVWATVVLLVGITEDFQETGWYRLTRGFGSVWTTGRFWTDGALMGLMYPISDFPLNLRCAHEAAMSMKGAKILGLTSSIGSVWFIVFLIRRRVGPRASEKVVPED